MKIFKRVRQYMRSVYIMEKLGIGTTAPSTKLDINGDLRVRTIITDDSLEKFLVVTPEGKIFGRTLRHIHPIKEISQNYNVLFNDHTLIVNNVTPVTLTLPDATMQKGIIFNFKWVHVSASIAVIQPSNNQTIDGNSSSVLSSSNQFIRLQSDGSNWYIIN